MSVTGHDYWAGDTIGG